METGQDCSAPAEPQQAADVFETAFARAPMGIALIEMSGHFVRVNDALCEMLGRTEAELIGSTSTPFTHPDDLQLTADAYAHLSSASTPLSIEKRYLRPDGEVVWAATRGTAVNDAEGRPIHIVSHFNNITPIKIAQQRQAEANAQFEAAFADAPIGMALVDLDGRCLKVNRVLCQMSGYSAEALLELSFGDLTHPDDRDRDLEQLQRLMAGEIDRYTVEKRYFTAEGELVSTNLSVSLVRDPSRRPMNFIAQIEDISESKRLEAKLRHLADHDPLTELWNRRRFNEQLDRQVARCHRYEEQASLLMIDLNRFKQVNDTHGHGAGDTLLKTVAKAIQSRLRLTDSLARLGGDEFAVILTNITPDQATDMAAVLGEALSAASISVDGATISVSASIGIAHLDQHTPSDEHALVQADTSMYDTKTERRDQPRRHSIAVRTIAATQNRPV